MPSCDAESTDARPAGASRLTRADFVRRSAFALGVPVFSPLLAPAGARHRDSGPRVSFAAAGARTRAAKASLRQAGCTHVHVPAFWADLQDGPVTPLRPAALAGLRREIADAHDLGLRVILEFALQYPPDRVAAAIEPFVSQSGERFDDSLPSGRRVRNWLWQDTGRAAVADFVTRVSDALGPSAQVELIRIGGGVFGELQYPPPPDGSAGPPRYWAYGESMQQGRDIAAGMEPCPYPGYVPFEGSPAQDRIWIEWYLGGLERWLLWFASLLEGTGWTCPLHVLHPGFGIRPGWLHDDPRYRDALASGSDPARLIAAYANDPQIWPWCTWLSGRPSAAGGVPTAWRFVYETARRHGKHTRLWGENPGGEDDAGMDAIFGGPLAPSPSPTGSITPPYTGLMWVNYRSLTSGDGRATLDHYAAHIASTRA